MEILVTSTRINSTVAALLVEALIYPLCSYEIEVLIKISLNLYLNHSFSNCHFVKTLSINLIRFYKVLPFIQEFLQYCDIWIMLNPLIPAIASPN
jgi:hypothetical protein